MGVLACSPQADAGAHVACAAGGGWGNVGWGKADAPGLGAATIATKISSIQACPWQPASQPAVEQQGTWAVRLQATTGQQWAYRPAQAAAAGAGEAWGRALAGGGPHAWQLQQKRGQGEAAIGSWCMWHVGGKQPGKVALQAVPCQLQHTHTTTHSCGLGWRCFHRPVAW